MKWFFSRCSSLIRKRWNQGFGVVLTFWMRLDLFYLFTQFSKGVDMFSCWKTPRPLLRYVLKSPADGAKTSVLLATDPQGKLSGQALDSGSWGSWDVEACLIPILIYNSWCFLSWLWTWALMFLGQSNGAGGKTGIRHLCEQNKQASKQTWTSKMSFACVFLIARFICPPFFSTPCFQAGHWASVENGQDATGRTAVRPPQWTSIPWATCPRRRRSALHGEEEESVYYLVFIIVTIISWLLSFFTIAMLIDIIVASTTIVRVMFHFGLPCCLVMSDLWLVGGINVLDSVQSLRVEYAYASPEIQKPQKATGRFLTMPLIYIGGTKTFRQKLLVV